MRPLEPGLRIRAYQLQSRLGVGAQGEVWLATGPQGEEVALKAVPVMRSAGEDAAQEQNVREEFERLRTIHLPSVVRVLDVGSDQGYLFFTMDVALGLPMDAAVAKHSSMAERIQCTAQAGADVARALAAMHRQGLAHRDIKPANIIVDTDQRATVLDFGTAGFGYGDGLGPIVGTPQFMAPEQRLAMPFDHKVDAYALGATLYQCISQNSSIENIKGQHMPLALLGKDVPLALSHHVSRLLALDPQDRPGAEESELLLRSIADKKPLPTAPLPAPWIYQGSAKPLLNWSGVVVGPVGSGRNRLITEARWLWHKQGYRSIAGQCDPTRPLGALRQILSCLDAEISKAAQSDRNVLSSIDPKLAQADQRDEAWPPDPRKLALAFETLLARSLPIALVFWNLDQADIGTRVVVSLLASQLPEQSRLWATSSKGIAPLPMRHPPRWHAGKAQKMLTSINSLLPPVSPDELLIDAITKKVRPLSVDQTPLETVYRMWRRLPHHHPPSIQPERLPELSPLTVLDAPFPFEVAKILVPTIVHWISIGALRPSLQTPNQQNLEFCDHETFIRARCALHSPKQARIDAAAAWAWSGPEERRIERQVHHLLFAGKPEHSLFRHLISTAMERDQPAEVERWLQMMDLLRGTADDFTMRHARLYTRLELRRGDVTEADLIDLEALIHSDNGPSAARDARSENHRACMVEHLRIIRDTRNNPNARGLVARGRRLSSIAAVEQPILGSLILREVAWAQLRNGSAKSAIQDCQAALKLARSHPINISATQKGRTTQAEVNAGITLSASLIYASQLNEAEEYCLELAHRCEATQMPRGQAALLINAGISQLYKGNRRASEQSAANSQPLQSQHKDPILLANCALLRGRLAIERGDIGSGKPLINEAISLGKAIDSNAVLAEAWSMALEKAVHNGAPTEAKQALAAYGSARDRPSVRSKLDHWPAVFARWLWLSGDLKGALAATESVRDGHSNRCITAERCRLLLVAGQYAEARSQALELQKVVKKEGMLELALFAELVAGAAGGVANAVYAPLLIQSEKSQWTHLYLGALHLDAVRRRLRGENVAPLITRFRARALDLKHQLYLSLCRKSAW